MFFLVANELSAWPKRRNVIRTRTSAKAVFTLSRRVPFTCRPTSVAGCSRPTFTTTSVDNGSFSIIKSTRGRFVWSLGVAKDMSLSQFFLQVLHQCSIVTRGTSSVSTHATPATTNALSGISPKHDALLGYSYVSFNPLAFGAW